MIERHTGSFQYTVRTIANYIILFVDRLFIIAHNYAKKIHKPEIKNLFLEWSGQLFQDISTK